MNIYDFSYIKFEPSGNSLIEKIESFYRINDKESTLEHGKAVAKTNANIAKRYELDEEKCFLSGLLHDISAVMEPNDMLIYAKAHGIDLDESEKRYPFLLHQQLSKTFVETVFNINDLDILSAIECHTTLKASPSKYDMSLFIADKLAWDQEGKPPFYDIVNNALSESLEAASFQYITYMLENNLILYPHKWFLDAKNFLESHLTK